jgi:hypothetical protein
LEKNIGVEKHTGKFRKSRIALTSVCVIEQKVWPNFASYNFKSQVVVLNKYY